MSKVLGTPGVLPTPIPKSLGRFPGKSKKEER